MSSPVSFRQATRADLAEILHFPINEIELFYFSPSAHYPLKIEHLDKQLSDRHESTVMIEHTPQGKKNIIGFANFYNVENKNIAFIGNVIIKPEKRRQGFGKKLIKAMLKFGFEKLKLQEIHLSCYEANSKALLFYKDLGFEPYATEARKDLHNLPTTLIHLKLTSLKTRKPASSLLL